MTILGLIVGGVIFAVLLALLIFVFAAARETGRLEERVKKLHEEADRQQKRAEVMAESREPKDAIDRLERGNF